MVLSETDGGSGGGLALGGGTASTGGNGTAGGLASGGGTAGSSVGATGQELVSGTRLKAVVLKGADGAVAPVKDLFGTSAATVDVFWDTQLNTYCSPVTADFLPPFKLAAPSSAGVCYPPFFSSVRAYTDQACTQLANPCFAPFSRVLSLNRTPTVAVVTLDAGIPELRRVVLSGARYQRPDFLSGVWDGGCTPIPGPLFEPAGSVSVNDLASMNLVIEP